MNVYKMQTKITIYVFICFNWARFEFMASQIILLIESKAKRKKNIYSVDMPENNNINTSSFCVAWVRGMK